MQPLGLPLIFELIGIEPSGNCTVFILLWKIWEVSFKETEPSVGKDWHIPKAKTKKGDQWKGYTFFSSKIIRIV